MAQFKEKFRTIILAGFKLTAGSAISIENKKAEKLFDSPWIFTLFDLQHDRFHPAIANVFNRVLIRWLFYPDIHGWILLDPGISVRLQTIHKLTGQGRVSSDEQSHRPSF